MRRIAIVVGACAALAILGIAPSGAGAAFTQCPAVELDASCQFLVTVNNGETVLESDPAVGPFDPGGDDTLIGVQNNSSKPVSSLPFSAEIELFGFEFDGLCEMTKPAPGCKVVAKNTSGEPNLNAGKPCPPEVLACGFEPEGGEPTGIVAPADAFPIGELANGDPVYGYEGPTSYFTNIGAFGTFSTGTGTVNFSPPIPPGGHTYFGLESPPGGGFGSAATLTTTLSGGGQSGANITVVQNTPVTDSATLGGAGGSTATGPVSFNVYSDAECKTLVVSAGSAKLAGGNAGPSSSISTLSPGTYYWQAHYAGSLSAQAATSQCGSEVLTVQALTTTTTAQSGGGVSGASIPVLVKTPVTDQAKIAGFEAANATGTVNYTLWSDSKCTKPVSTSGTPVTGGVVGPSAPVVPTKSGTYWWTASYSGGGLNAPSASACGSEVLYVSKKGQIFPKSFGKKCFSKRKFAVHPKFPKGVKVTSFKEFINGALATEGHLTNHATSVNLIGLPKGAYKVELVTFTSDGQSFQDTRTFHTCVTKRRHHHK